MSFMSRGGGKKRYQSKRQGSETSFVTCPHQRKEKGKEKKAKKFSLHGKGEKKEKRKGRGFKRKKGNLSVPQDKNEDT